MATFRKYKTKKGMLWRYQILVGTDTVTGKSIRLRVVSTQRKRLN